MKRILLIAAQALLCSLLTIANTPEPPNTIAEENQTAQITEESPLDAYQAKQQSLDFKNSIHSNSMVSGAPKPMESGGGLPPGAPIDDYLPLLAVAALGLVAIFHKQIFVK